MSRVCFTSVNARSREHPRVTRADPTPASPLSLSSVAVAAWVPGATPTVTVRREVQLQVGARKYGTTAFSERATPGNKIKNTRNAHSQDYNALDFAK